VFFLALCVGIVALVVVSLATPAEPEKQLRSFFDRLSVPSDGPEAAGLGTAENLPPAEIDARQNVAARDGRQLLLVNLFRLREGARGFGFFRAYRDDLKGFAIGWAITGGLVFFVWWLFKA
jgi:hypothetical protein